MRKWSHPSIGRALIISLINIACGIVGEICLLGYGHRKDPQLKQEILNFGSAWLPFVLSIIVAFIPSQEKRRKAHMIWRACLIVAGLGTSVVMWQQQVVSIKTAKADQESVVMEAVDKANTHTDIEVKTVRDDLKNVSTGLSSLGERFDKGASDLKDSISKVGKPDPPKITKLQFSLWSDILTFPVLAVHRRPDKDWIFTIDFAVQNTSPTTGHLVDTWIDICMACEFNEEPSGFDRPLGLGEKTRHRIYQILNPTAATEKQTIKVKFNEHQQKSFQIAFRYSCETCGGAMTRQVATIEVLPPMGQK